METETLRLRDSYVNSLSRSLTSGLALKNVPGLLRHIIEGDMWQERMVTQTGEVVTYRRFVDFVTAPMPKGLQTTVNLLIDICQTYGDMQAVGMIAQAEGGKQGNPTGANQWSGNSNNITVSTGDTPDRGTSVSYTMRRLAKTAPEIHERVVAGELSPNAAAIEAGFRVRKMQIPADPEAAGRYFAGRVDREWMEAMLDAFYSNIDA
jgi:hypothetical protein